MPLPYREVKRVLVHFVLQRLHESAISALQIKMCNCTYHLLHH